MKSVTVPGNLLVTGEYAVTEEGGIGMACAIAPRVVAWVEDAPDLRVEGRIRKTVLEWRETGGSLAGGSRSGGSRSGGSRSGGLLEHIVPFLLDQQHSRRTGHVIVDSSAFFGPDGRKLGFGSSAAVTVALASLLGADPQTPDEEILHPAVAAHRHAQGGRGSGYDVAASLFGGAGLFIGGKHPSWEPRDGWWMGHASLVLNERHTDTVDAVRRHAAWRDSFPGTWQHLHADSEAATRRLAGAETWRDVKAAIVHARHVGREIGAAVGVPACIDTAFEDHIPKGDTVCKSVGAGSELMLCLANPEDLDSDRAYPGEANDHSHVLPLILEEEGLRWE